MVDEEIAMVLPEYIGWKDLVYQVVLIQKVHGFLDASVLPVCDLIPLAD